MSTSTYFITYIEKLHWPYLLLNRDRAEEKVIINGFDALIATSNVNVFYTSDVYPFD